MANITSENPHLLGNYDTYIGTTNPKTAFERELNSPLPLWLQIWPKVNRLASTYRSLK